MREVASSKSTPNDSIAPPGVDWNDPSKNADASLQSFKTTVYFVLIISE